MRVSDTVDTGDGGGANAIWRRPPLAVTACADTHNVPPRRDSLSSSSSMLPSSSSVSLSRRRTAMSRTRLCRLFRYVVHRDHTRIRTAAAAAQPPRTITPTFHPLHLRTSQANPAITTQQQKIVVHGASLRPKSVSQPEPTRTRYLTHARTYKTPPSPSSYSIVIHPSSSSAWSSSPGPRCLCL